MPQINRRRKKRGGPNWNTQRGAIGAASGALTGFRAGGPWGAAAGAGLGLVTGGLTGVDADIDRAGYEAALREFEVDTRRSARVTGNELSAQTGASLAARGINNSELGAGIVSANRGRLMSAANQQVSKYRGDLYKAIADAENQMQQADDAMTRQWWTDLAGQLTYWGLTRTKGADDQQALTGDIISDSTGDYLGVADYLQKHGVDAKAPPKSSETTQSPFESDVMGEVQLGPNIPRPGFESRSIEPRDRLDLGIPPFSEAVPKPDIPRPTFREYPPVDERAAKGVTGAHPSLQEDPISVPSGREGEPIFRSEPDWREGGPLKKQITEALPPEEIEALETIFPDLDKILIHGDADPGRSHPGYPEAIAPAPQPKAPAPIQEDSSIDPMAPLVPKIESDSDVTIDTDEGVVIDLPPGISLPGRPGPFLINSEYVDEPKMRGLPRSMAYTYHDEGGHNPHDPSYAGVHQDTYDNWTGKPPDAPLDVKDLGARPDVINGFYHWYLDTQTFIPQVFSQNEGLAYMYNDFAIHAGGPNAKMVYEKAIIKLRGEGITMPTDLDLLMAFDGAKRDHYRLQGKNANAFLDRANRVRQRANSLIN